MRASIFALLLLAACSLDTPTSGSSAADAGISAQPQNALGANCTTAADCPDNPSHQCVFLKSGNPAVGYCSPLCASDGDCTAGYGGPATGEPTCFVPDTPQACSILCQSNGDCPSELECKITGGPVNVCATR